MLTIFSGGLFTVLKHGMSGQPSEQVRDEAVTDLNLSLFSQHLDEIFELLLVAFTSVETLSPEDQFLLQSWLQFDERFVEHNRNQSSLKYERVSAHLRLAKGLLLLDKPIPSLAHFQSAIELLELLSDENPTIFSYRLELSDTYQAMGTCLELLGRSREAVVALDSAIRTLLDPVIPPQTGQEERLEKLYQYRDQELLPNGLVQ
ncbi:MAG TPA: hypothetical protein VLA12_12395 [Planctomycetaceae bacterium]|nr:hypothetical protein [Planctomycetaceae bacterium]